MADSKTSGFHIVMFPWFAVGHMTPFLHLSNKLAEKGFHTTFLLPKKAIQQLQHFNLNPSLITFHTLTIPPVDGLPEGTETASEIPIHMAYLLSIAMDRTRDQVEQVIRETKPKMVVYDMAHWVSEITKPLGIKALNYNVVCAMSLAIVLVPARKVTKGKPLTEEELATPPPGYPSSVLVLHGPEAKSLEFVCLPFGEGITFYERISTALKDCDAIAIRTCHETEAKFCEYIGNQYGKKVFVTGPVLPEQMKKPLEDKWAEWLGRFEPSSVIFCAFGSQYVLEKNQFQELLLGFEQTDLPFLVAVKTPTGASSIEEALPEGFAERVKGRGIVEGRWVPQVMILDHPSIGCFVNHCGFGSMWESLMSKSQIVLIPHLGDQILNTRLLTEELKVGVEVEKDENGWVSKDNLCKSIKFVMDKENKEASVLRSNHTKWRDIFGNPSFMSSYIDKFVEDINELIHS